MTTTAPSPRSRTSNDSRDASTIRTWQCALQLAVAWTLPIVDDFDGALEAASTALAGFRQQNEPFVAFAALTVGMLEMTLGRDDTAASNTSLEVNELGGQFGNTWLEWSARTQLASLAVRAGHLDEARALLVESAGSIEDTQLSALTVSSRSSPTPSSRSRKQTTGELRWPSVPPTGCASVRACGRGR